MITFTIRKDFDIQMDITGRTINKLKKDLKDFIGDNSSAIAEINAINDSSPVYEMESIVNICLPDVNYTEIVRKWILQYNDSTYWDYLKTISRDYNKKYIWQDIIYKYQSYYYTEQKSFLKTKILKGNIWSYCFDLTNMSIQVLKSTDNAIFFSHTSEIKPELTMYSDLSIHTVDEDKVWLGNFKEEINSSYTNNLRDMILKHATNRYSEVFNNDFIPNHHDRFLQGLEKYMKSISWKKHTN